MSLTQHFILRASTNIFKGFSSIKNNGSVKKHKDMHMRAEAKKQNAKTLKKKLVSSAVTNAADYSTNKAIHGLVAPIMLVLYSGVTSTYSDGLN